MVPAIGSGAQHKINLFILKKTHKHARKDIFLKNNIY